MTAVSMFMHYLAPAAAEAPAAEGTLLTDSEGVILTDSEGNQIVSDEN